MESKFLKDGGYFMVGTYGYEVFIDKEGSLKAKSYVPGKGFVEVDGWEILTNGEKVSKKEYDKYLAYEKAQDMALKSKGGR